MIKACLKHKIIALKHLQFLAELTKKSSVYTLAKIQSVIAGISIKLLYSVVLLLLICARVEAAVQETNKASSARINRESTADRRSLSTTKIVSANNSSTDSKVKVPDFVYLKANEVNLRSGPDAKHPIKWVVKQRGEPMQVIETFYQWLHVKNIDGYEGWMQSPLASKKQIHGVVLSSDNKPVLAYAMSSTKARKVMLLAPKARVRVMKCNAAGWCKIKAKELVAWTDKKNLWGI